MNDEKSDFLYLIIIGLMTGVVAFVATLKKKSVEKWYSGRE